MFKSYGILLAIGLLIAFGWSTQPGAEIVAAEDEVSTEAVVGETLLTVVVYPDGRTGFFDQTTRTIFIYDQALRRCVTIRQIETLGDELERVRN